MSNKKLKPSYKLIKTVLGKHQEIPNEWDLFRLIDLCKTKPQYGANLPALPKDERLPRYIRITDLNDDGTLRENEWKSISKKDAEKYILRDGDVLFARTGATVGKTYLYRKEDGECAFAGYLIRFVPDETRLKSKYLFQYVHSPYYWKWLNSVSTEGAQPNVNAEQYSHLLISLPPIEEQDSIASILFDVDLLLQQTKHIVEHVQKTKQGLMQKLLTEGIGHTKFKETKIGKIPTEWNLIKLKNYVRKIGSGVTPLGGEKVYQKTGIPFIRSQNVHFDGIHLENVAYITQKTHDEMSSTKLKEYDVLLNITGASIGRCTYVPKNFGEGNVNQHVCIIRTTNELNPIFLSIVLSSQIGQNRIFQTQVGLSREGLTFKEIGLFDIPLPKLDEQEKITQMFFKINEQIKYEKQYKFQLENLKKGLMQKLLTGQLRV